MPSGTIRMCDEEPVRDIFHKTIDLQLFTLEPYAQVAYEKRLVRGAVPKITAPATWKTDSAESSAHKFFELSPKHASI